MIDWLDQPVHSLSASQQLWASRIKLHLLSHLAFGKQPTGRITVLDEIQKMSSEKQDVEKASPPKTEPEHPDNLVAGKFNLDTWEKLLYYSARTEGEKRYFVEFRLLQRLNIIEMQSDLAQFTADVRNRKSQSLSDPEKESLRKTLHEYGTNLRHSDPLTPC
jgi:hypothetical protein